MDVLHLWNRLYKFYAVKLNEKNVWRKGQNAKKRKRHSGGTILLTPMSEVLPPKADSGTVTTPDGALFADGRLLVVSVVLSLDSAP